jgi:hypothetical protein
LRIPAGGDRAPLRVRCDRDGRVQPDQTFLIMLRLRGQPPATIGLDARGSSAGRELSHSKMAEAAISKNQGSSG